MLASGGGHEGCLRLLIATGANLEHQHKVRECDVLSLGMLRGGVDSCWIARKVEQLVLEVSEMLERVGGCVHAVSCFFVIVLLQVRSTRGTALSRS